ncbi:MAG: HAD-IIA family hydrolase [Nitrososphaerales archaeon]|jgi:HAD superfamily hydrolase (TIGR01450 family)
MIDLSGKKLFLFDLDGVLLKGKESPTKIGGTRIFERIRSQGKKLRIITNNSTDTVEAVRRRLASQGIVVERDELLTSARLTAEYIARRYGAGATYFLVGEAGFAEELDSLGLRRTRGAKADVVAIGLDRRLTYGKLDRAVRLARGGADIVANHSARLYMARRGPAIAVGPILRAVECGSSKRGFAVGKPAPLMFEIAMERAGCTKRETVMIGDQEDTDVEGAHRAGIESILVRTGVYDGKARTKATAVIGSVDELADMI